MNKTDKHFKMSSDTSNEVKAVQREKIFPCITCLLCKLPFIEATTINECLHTFCKRCIYDKIINENMKFCPVCKVELGTAPLNKLRSDNSLQVLCDKILTSAEKKFEEMRSMAPVIQPKKIEPLRMVQNRRKEKPLSSLVDDLPKLPNHSIITKKHSKLTRATRNCTPIFPVFYNNETSNKGEQSCHKNEASSSNPPTENVIPQQNQEGNDGAIVIARRPQTILPYDLNELPTIIDEDESNLESITKNVSDELKVEAEEANNDIVEDEITNAEDGITNTTTIREVDLNEPLNPPTEENAQLLDLNKNENTNEPPNLPIEENAPTHDHNKNEAITPSDTPAEEKEIVFIVIDDSDEEEEMGFKSMNVAPTSYHLNKKNVSIIRDPKDKGKEIETSRNVNVIRDSKDKGNEKMHKEEPVITRNNANVIHDPIMDKEKEKMVVHHDEEEPIISRQKVNVILVPKDKENEKMVVHHDEEESAGKSRNVNVIDDPKDKGKEEMVVNHEKEPVIARNVNAIDDPKKDTGKEKTIVHYEEKPVISRPIRKFGKRRRRKMAKPHKAPSPDPIPELPPLIQVPKPELPEDDVVNITSNRPKANRQVWFNLSPSQHGDGGTLPPLTSSHFHVWDQNITIAKVERLIATKLNLKKEEIEVMLRGLPVISPMSIGCLQEVWLQNAPGRFQAIDDKV